MKKMTKFFALALLAGAMVSCSTEDIAPSTQNDKVAVQFTGGISVNTRAAGVAWADGDRIGILDVYKRQDLPYMTELSDMPEQKLTEALKGRIYYLSLIHISFPTGKKDSISLFLAAPSRRAKTCHGECSKAWKSGSRIWR